MIGTQVSVVQKEDQSTGRLTNGTVAEILTNSTFHPRGIKVRLTDGIVGRIGPDQLGGATRINHHEGNTSSSNDNNYNYTRRGQASCRPAPSLADFLVVPPPSIPPQPPTESATLGESIVQWVGEKRPENEEDEDDDMARALSQSLYLAIDQLPQPLSSLAPPTLEWACPACTFVNSGLLPECELCQTAVCNSKNDNSSTIK